MSLKNTGTPSPNGQPAAAAEGRERAAWKYLFIIALLLVYGAAVWWYTIGNRPTAYVEPKLKLFWSYREWLAGKWNYGMQILANILMFVPFGFLLPTIIRKPRKALPWVIAAAVFFHRPSKSPSCG